MANTLKWCGRFRPVTNITMHYVFVIDFLGTLKEMFLVAGSRFNILTVDIIGHHASGFVLIKDKRISSASWRYASVWTRGLTKKKYTYYFAQKLPIKNKKLNISEIVYHNNITNHIIYSVNQSLLY